MRNRAFKDDAGGTANLEKGAGGGQSGSSILLKPCLLGNAPEERRLKLFQDMDTKRTPEQRAKRLMDENEHMTLATADSSGAPWVSPVFFVTDDAYDIYWVSDRDARHSQNVRHNPLVAVVVFETDPTVDAVYVSGRAKELKDVDEVRHAIAILDRRPQPEKWKIQDITDVTGGGPWRIYRASVETIEVRADAMRGTKDVVGREFADFR